MIPQPALLTLLVGAAAVSTALAQGPSPGPAPGPSPEPEACAIDPPWQCPWYNSTLPLEERRAALMAALTPSEKLTILAQGAVDRLHVVAASFNEALHGVAWTGRATVFPCPMALGATFDTNLVEEIGAAVAKEGLAKHWSKEHSNALSFFAPNINIVRDVRWGRAQETYGEDPTLTGKLGAAYVKGMQFLGGDPATAPLAVRNVAKHFAAYNLESDFAGRKTPAEIAKGDGQYRLSYDATVTDADLKQTFLPAFESVVRDAKIRGVMCAYNSVNGTPLCANKLLKEQLREGLGFEDGIVITDCQAISFMTSNHKWAHPNGTRYTDLEATAATLRAGTDLNCGDFFALHLPAALAAGLVTQADIDTAVARALTGQMELGLFQDSKTSAADSRRNFSMDIVDSPSHRQLAKRAAIEGTVLLKNENNVLPLKVSSGLRLAVVGPNANRTMTLVSNYAGCKDQPGGPLLPTCKFVNPLEGIRAAVAAAGGSEVVYAPGVDIDTPNRSGIPAAVEAARDADVVVVVAGLITCQEIGDQCQEAEARDRSTPVNADGTDNSTSSTDIGRDYGIGLPGQQSELLRALVTATEGTKTKIVLVVMSGSAVAIPWAAASPQVAAIVQLFYPGVLGGEALADVLTGMAAPGGKLPVMIPTSEAQLPADYLNQSMQAGQGRTHRYFSGTPLFQFGHGLGYSTFAYSNLTVFPEKSLVLGMGSETHAHDSTALTISVSVTNNGEFARTDSSETVMVFARPVLASAPTPSMSVPRQQLLAFTKVRLRPGETQRVKIEIPIRHLQLVGPSGKLMLLEGRYELFIGGQAPGADGSVEVDGRGGKAAGAAPLLRYDLLVPA